jgi:phosphomevalonate kinase
MLADVDAGSDTPSLVGKVLKWRSSNQEEGQLRSLRSVIAQLMIN